jgi:DnaJ homolog subfamily C member 19
MKLVLILALAALACRLFAGRWPWELMRGAERTDRLAEARRVLGLRKGAKREEIVEAHRRLIATVHPDRGGTSERVHEANAARDVLLDRDPGTD